MAHTNIGTGLDKILPASGHVVLGIVDDLEHGYDLCGIVRTFASKLSKAPLTIDNKP